MKTFRKSLCLLLSVMMIMGSCLVFSSAAEESTYVADYDTETPVILVHGMSQNNTYLLDENGEWVYCVGNLTEWTTGKANADDLKLIEEYMQVSFFTTATQNAIKFAPLDIPESSIEHFSIYGVNIVLQLQAIEAEYVNEQFFS